MAGVKGAGRETERSGTRAFSLALKLLKKFKKEIPRGWSPSLRSSESKEEYCHSDMRFEKTDMRVGCRGSASQSRK